MNLRHTALFAALAAFSLHAAETSEGMKEKMNALIKEDSKEAASKAEPAATEKKDKPAAQTPPVNPILAENDKSKEKVVDLPAMTVEATKLPQATPTIIEARDQMRKMDETIAREQERTVQTEADKALNPEALSIMGPLSAEGRAQDAKRRIQETEIKQAVAAVIADPNSEEENKKLLKMLEDLEYQKKKDSGSQSRLQQ